MLNQIFSEQEESLVSSAKSALYYPSGNISETIRSIFKGTEPERAAEILEVTLGQVGFEQKQRREYVLAAVGVTPSKQLIENELYVRALGDYGNNTDELSRFLTEAKIDQKTLPVPTQVSSEIIEQAKVYGTVANSLDELYTEALYRKRIMPIMTLLKRLSPDELTGLITGIKDFITRVKQLGNDIIVKNPDFSPAIMGLLERSGLLMLAQRRDTIGQKLLLCGDILLAAGVLAANAKQNSALNEEQTAAAAGLWLYNSEGPPLAEEIL